MITLIFWLLICLILSAFLSGSEMAFVSSDRVKIRRLADLGNHAAKRVLRFYKDQEQFLASILIGNNVVNVGATVLLTYMLSEYFDIESEALVTLIMTPLILIVGEIVPKDYCRLKARSVLLNFSAPLAWLFKALSSVSAVILKFVKWITRPFGLKTQKNIFVSEEEFRSMILEGTQAGVVGHHEKKIIDTILDFETTPVESVMIPLERVVKADLFQKVGDVKALAAQTGTDMVLIYEEEPSIVVGMIYVFDLLFEENKDLSLQPFLRSPIFIPQNTSNEKAFFTLQRKRQSYAVVIDENREVVGAVPVERLIAF